MPMTDCGPYGSAWSALRFAVLTIYLYWLDPATLLAVIAIIAWSAAKMLALVLFGIGHIVCAMASGMFG